MLPRLATFCRRMTSIEVPSVLIGVGQQRQKARPLDRHRELALIKRLRAGDAARNDLARLADIALQGGEILVVDRLHAFGGEAAELPATREAAAAATAPAAFSGHCHGCYSSKQLGGRAQTLSATELSSSSGGAPSSSRARSRRRPPSPSSSAALGLGEGSVSSAST